MRLISRLILVLALPSLLLLGQEKSALESDPQGWVDILPDATLKGWTRIPWTSVTPLEAKVQWHIDASGPSLICDGDGGHEWLRYDKELGDFILHVEWRFTPKEGETRYNSGIGVRLSRYGEIWHQAQTTLAGGYLLGDSFIDGSIQRKMLRDQMTENRVKPAGEWNVYEVRGEGGAISLWVNGAVTSEWKDLAVRKGYVALEAEGFPITFRNVKLKELP